MSAIETTIHPRHNVKKQIVFIYNKYIALKIIISLTQSSLLERILKP